MSDALCRVRIHANNETFDRTADLALPSALCVADLLPSVVELLHGAVSAPARWQLRRVGGEPIDESLTLAQNGVRDGEVLWLTADEVPPPVWSDLDVCHTLAGAVGEAGMSRGLCIGASLVAATLGAAALVWAADTAAVALGAVVTVAAVVAALLAHRDAALCGLSGVVAVLFAAATGALAAPDGAAASMLAGSAAAAVAVLVVRCTGTAVTALTALAVAALSGAGVSAATLVWHLHPVTSGAVLAAGSLVVLGAAPRLVIAVARPGPDLTPAAARRVHRLLSGVVAGAAVAASAGVLLALLTRPGLFTTAFAVTVGAALMLRTRVHADAVRRCALVVCGLAAVAGGFVATTVWAPQHAHGLSLLAVGAAAAAAGPVAGVGPGPGMRRLAEVGEYLVLAAAIPLACLVSGLFGLVRGLALS